MRVLWLGLLVGVLALAHAQEARLQDDPALQKRITVWMPITALEEVLREVSRQTGVPLSCQDSLRDVKVCVFVQEGAAATLLEAVAKLLGYRWRTREGGGYTLYIPDETRRALQQALNQDRRATEQALRETLRLVREWLRLPREQRTQWLSKWSAEGASPEAHAQEAGDKLPHSLPSALGEYLRDYLQDYAPRGEEVGTVVQSLDRVGWHSFLVHSLAESGERMIRELLAGRTVGFSTRPAVGVHPLPSRVLLPFRMRAWALRILGKPVLGADLDIVPVVEGEPIAEEAPEARLVLKRELPNPEYAGFWVRLSGWGDFLEYRLFALAPARDAQQASEVWDDIRPLRLATEVYLRETEAWRTWERWATPPREWSAKLQHRQPLTRPEPRLAYDEMSLLLSVHLLEWVAWRTGYPVVSDASRFVSAPLGEEGQFQDPLAALTLLSQKMWLRFDESGYLLARHKRFWMLNQFEIPERLLRPVEAKWLRGEWLTLDDLASVAGYPNDTQARAFSVGSFWMRRRFQALFDSFFLYHSLPALRFWASLSGVQRRQAMSGEWLAESTLTLPQRARFREALYGDFPPPERLFSSLPPYNHLLGGDALYTAAPQQAEPRLTLGYTSLPSLDDLDTALKYVPDRPAFRVVVRPVRYEASFLWQSDEQSIPRLFKLEGLRSIADLSLDALRQRLGTSGTPVHGALVARYACYLELFVPPRYYKRYFIEQTRWEEIPRQFWDSESKASDPPQQENRGAR